MYVYWELQFCTKPSNCFIHSLLPWAFFCNRTCCSGGHYWNYDPAAQVSATPLRSGTCRWNLMVLELQMSCSDLTKCGIGFQDSSPSNGQQGDMPYSVVSYCGEYDGMVSQVSVLIIVYINMLSLKQNTLFSPHFVDIVKGIFFRFHWSLFSSVQWITRQHWFR